MSATLAPPIHTTGVRVAVMVVVDVIPDEAVIAGQRASEFADEICAAAKAAESAAAGVLGGMADHVEARSRHHHRPIVVVR